MSCTELMLKSQEYQDDITRARGEIQSSSLVKREKKNRRVFFLNLKILKIILLTSNMSIKVMSSLNYTAVHLQSVKITSVKKNNIVSQGQRVGQCHRIGKDSEGHRMSLKVSIIVFCFVFVFLRVVPQCQESSKFPLNLDFHYLIHCTVNCYCIFSPYFISKDHVL